MESRENLPLKMNASIWEGFLLFIRQELDWEKSMENLPLESEENWKKKSTLNLSQLPASDS